MTSLLKCSINDAGLLSAFHRKVYCGLASVLLATQSIHSLHRGSKYLENTLKCIRINELFYTFEKDLFQKFRPALLGIAEQCSKGHTGVTIQQTFAAKGFYAVSFDECTK